jgi:hypothetical protein
MHSAQEVTAYHEAGHARAAVRRGASVNKIDISCDDENGNYLGNTAVDIDPAHEAFYAYAGPWVSARLINGPEDSVDIGRVMYYLRGSTADWPIFQIALGRTDVTDREAKEAYAVWNYGGDPPPGEVWPDVDVASGWHQDLADEWSEIEALARKMLDGIKEIAVGDGVLVQSNQTCWRRPGWKSDAAA